ncbi:hypothetical protein OESDEN_12849 [Oesophagostomum dentatum]|uniref:UAA transporter family protein n=1 Tax=Oesophagostomum dentatum TaxID=61180 RepID=A0A0B1SQZ0_OESDE|nr:hypothetical protein OESDEN_12849 [Oesophagostomum dentatum]
MPCLRKYALTGQVSIPYLTKQIDPTFNDEFLSRGYIPTVITFFTVNVVNNQALNFHVPVPLHIIFRSGSLLANLLLSVILLKKKYSLRKYLSVFAITLGIIICTLATSDLEKVR